MNEILIKLFIWLIGFLFGYAICKINSIKELNMLKEISLDTIKELKKGVRT